MLKSVFRVGSQARRKGGVGGKLPRAPQHLGARRRSKI